MWIDMPRRIVELVADILLNMQIAPITVPVAGLVVTPTTGQVRRRWTMDGSTKSHSRIRTHTRPFSRL